MNERIRELARESGLVQYDADSKMLDAERFAELIVLEAARWLGNREFASPEALKQHFGVK
jgi:hypothetical protein